MQFGRWTLKIFISIFQKAWMQIEPKWRTKVPWVYRPSQLYKKNLTPKHWGHWRRKWELPYQILGNVPFHLWLWIKTKESKFSFLLYKLNSFICSFINIILLNYSWVLVQYFDHPGPATFSVSATILNVFLKFSFGWLVGIELFLSGNVYLATV